MTGSSGFVGSHIVATLIDNGLEVCGLDRDPPVAGAEPSEYLACDVTDRESFAELIEGVEPDAIVHAAAFTPGDGEIDRTRHIVEVNQGSTLSALKAAARAGCRRFVFVSSAGVYADPAPGEVLTEASPVARTVGLYAQTKLASEGLCAWAARELGLLTTALRVGPAYGEFERPTGSRARMSPLHRAIELAISGETIRCNTGDTIYNWIHGSDIGRAIVAVLSSTPSQPVYNVAGPPITVAETLETLCELMDRDCEWTTGVDGANLIVPHVSRPISSALIGTELEFRPAVDLRAGMASVLAAHRA